MLDLLKIENIKYHYLRVRTLASKNIKLTLRFKLNFLYELVAPFIGIFLSIIVLLKFFGENIEFGTGANSWNETTMPIFLLIAYMLMLFKRIIFDIPNTFLLEKFWNTLQIMMIAPINRMHLLLGIVLSNLTIISVPFIIFFTITIILYPISFLTIIFVILIFFLIYSIFSGIGLILGIFMISNENFYSISTVIVNIIFIVSTITYPFDMFPPTIQKIIELNPFYYFFDFVRIAWVQNDFWLSISTYPLYFVLLLGFAILIPIISIYFFNIMYKKFGIVGY